MDNFNKGTCEICKQENVDLVTTIRCYPFPCLCCNGMHKTVHNTCLKCQYDITDGDSTSIVISTEHLRHPVKLGLYLIKHNFGKGRKGSYYDRWTKQLINKITSMSDISKGDADKIANSFMESLDNGDEENNYEQEKSKKHQRPTRMHK